MSPKHPGEGRVVLPCPEPPDWAIDWASLDPLPWLQAMRGCPQNPDRHAEGDVWKHVHMVTEAMVADPAWRALAEADRRTLFLSALLHDVAKPACTRIEANGRVSARGHSWRGAVKARAILWRLGVPFFEREAVCAIVRHHLVPFFLADSEDPRRLAIEVSQTARADWLTIMAEADVRGRICPDPQRMLDQVARFRTVAESLGCLAAPFPFESDHHRFQFFRNEERAPEPANTEVVLLSGLPGAGKDYWQERNLPEWPVVGLDAIRDAMASSSGNGQGDAVQRAKDLAREYLEAGQSFVWNAPNLSRNVRLELIRGFAAARASIRIVYVEVPPAQLFAQNRQRRRRVPDKVIERLLDRWEVPDHTEAHAVEFAVT